MGLRLPLPRIAGALVTGALAGLLAMGKGRRRRSWQRVRDAFGLLRSGNGRRVWRAVRIRAYSRSLSFGLRRDLRVPFTPPNPKIPLTMRPLGPQDDLAFLAPAAGLDQQAAWGRLNQRRLLADDLPTCWIATGPDGKVCYMQWLVAAKDNAHVRARWGGLFPELRNDEALLEGAYTAESCRGQGIMAHAMAKIAEAAQDFGAHQVITFVDHTNVASLKGCEKAGFAPYVERRVTWFLFRRRIRFVPVENATAAPSRSTRT
ncbi:MAG TPA: GNAT family N-acetyltransferase [Gemmatimonadales bacterium]|nr:GNAT family N-acetyltransferase [Gemmatimonadales bacterium]